MVFIAHTSLKILENRVCYPSGNRHPARAVR
jgi:hypothetical protein